MKTSLLIPGYRLSLEYFVSLPNRCYLTLSERASKDCGFALSEREPTPRELELYKAIKSEALRAARELGIDRVELSVKRGAKSWLADCWDSGFSIDRAAKARYDEEGNS